MSQVLIKITFFALLKYDQIVVLRFETRADQYIFEVLKRAGGHDDDLILVLEVAQEIDCSRMWDEAELNQTQEIELLLVHQCAHIDFVIAVYL